MCVHHSEVDSSRSKLGRSIEAVLPKIWIDGAYASVLMPRLENVPLP